MHCKVNLCRYCATTILPGSLNSIDQSDYRMWPMISDESCFSQSVLKTKANKDHSFREDGNRESIDTRNYSVCLSDFTFFFV